MSFVVILLVLVVEFGRLHARLDLPECEAFLQRADCYFYSCLDSKYRCGPSNFLVTFGYDFCDASTNIFAAELDAAATKTFFDVQNCSMRTVSNKLLESTISSRFRCADLDERLVDVHFDCLLPHFASILCENLEPIVSIFLQIDPKKVNLIEFLRRLLSSSTRRRFTVPQLFVSFCREQKRLTIDQETLGAMLSKRYQRKN